MKKLLTFIFILFAVSVFAQNTHTPNYYLTKILAGTKNYADTANHNMTRLDSIIKAKQDTIDAVKGDLYTQHKYDGSHQDGVITWANIATAAKTEIVQTSGTQSIAGQKTFTDNIITENVIPSADLTYALGTFSARWARISAKAAYVDTIIFSSNGNSGVGIIHVTDGGVRWQVPTYYDSASHFSQLGGFKLTPNSINLASGDTMFFTGVEATTISLTADANITNLTTIYSSIEDPEDSQIPGRFIILVNIDDTHTITLKDATIPTGNIELASEYTMGNGDSITLLGVNMGFNVYKWIEIARANN